MIATLEKQNVDCMTGKRNTSKRWRVTAILLPLLIICHMISNGSRLDYQPLSGKGARAPPPNFSGRVDQTRESGGNRAYNGRRMAVTRQRFEVFRFLIMQSTFCFSNVAIITIPAAGLFRTQTGHRIEWDHFDILATGQSDCVRRSGTQA